MGPKQREMDEIISRIYNKLKEDESTPSLVIICSDHGMNLVTKKTSIFALLFVSAHVWHSLEIMEAARNKKRPQCWCSFRRRHTTRTSTATLPRCLIRGEFFKWI
jgi:predicted AlkP superfamily pyrophosphatase or phosphodiesterase